MTVISNKDLHICQVFLSRGDGGLEKHVAELANSLSQNGKVSVIADEMYREKFSGSVDFYPIDASSSRYSPFLILRMRGLLKQINPDIIHAHAGKAACVVALIKSAFKQQKLVVTRHNTTNPSAYYLNKFDASIAVSQMVADSEPGVKWNVIENGTEPLGVSSEADAIQQPAIITVGRLVKIKCLDYVLKAWQNPDAHLYIVGDGPERESLEKQAQALKLKNIHFVGFTDRVGDYLAKAHLMLMPSLKEGAPYALVEALLAKVPVVSTDVGNAASLLPAKAIIPMEDHHAIRRTIEESLQHPESFSQAFADSFRYAEENLTLEKMVENTLAVYTNR